MYKKYEATLINNEGCLFDVVSSTSITKIKQWAKDRSGIYTLEIYDHLEAVIYKYIIKNNRVCNKTIDKVFK